MQFIVVDTKFLEFGAFKVKANYDYFFNFSFLWGGGGGINVNIPEKKLNIIDIKTGRLWFKSISLDRVCMNEILLLPYSKNFCEFYTSYVILSQVTRISDHSSQ